MIMKTGSTLQQKQTDVPPLNGTRVEVYWNLHKDTYSVRDLSTNKVVYHGHNFQLRDAKFAVQKAGNAKVRREGIKNVHAFVRGYFYNAGNHTECTRIATYNPFKYRSFVCADTTNPIYVSKRVHLDIGPNGKPIITFKKGK